MLHSKLHINGPIQEGGWGVEGVGGIKGEARGTEGSKQKESHTMAGPDGAATRVRRDAQTSCRFESIQLGRSSFGERRMKTWI